MSLSSALEEAIRRGHLSSRIWLYSNYHCNLSCRYCLTESSPESPKRMLTSQEMIRCAKEAKAHGIQSIGITGGEPFLRKDMVNILLDITAVLPVIILSNGTLFNQRRITEMQPLVGRDLTIQISLDRPDPIANDEMRGDTNFAKVVEAIPALLQSGHLVKVATTVEVQSAEEARRLSTLLLKLGITSDSHIIRTVVSRGRAISEGLGVQPPLEKMPPELTITADGAFYSPFAPTFLNGRLQSDLLICRTVSPLSKPLHMLLNLCEGNQFPAEKVEGFT